MGQQPSFSQEIPLDHIDQSDRRFQMRVVTRVSDIKRSLESEHQHEPVELLGPAPYRIIDGFRRCQAATELGWATIRAEVREGLSEQQAFRMAFASNYVRKSLSTLDRANAMRLALKLGIAMAELPKMFGLSEKQVQRYLALGNLPKAVQEVIDDEFVTMAHAMLLAKHAVGNLVQAAADIKAQKLSVRDLRKSLEVKLGSKAVGRPKGLYSRDHDVVRIRSVAISLSASPNERDAWAEQLLRLVALLQRDQPVVVGKERCRGDEPCSLRKGRTPHAME